jgi:alpha-mannosidase
MPVDIETSEGIIAVTEEGKALVVNSRGMKISDYRDEPAAIA